MANFIAAVLLSLFVTCGSTWKGSFFNGHRFRPLRPFGPAPGFDSLPHDVRDNVTAEEMYLTSFPFMRKGSSLFLLQSLARDKHAPNVATDFLAEYDYIVVGSGPGGSTVAARLSEMPCVKVLLLEAGKLPPRLTEVPVLARAFFGTDIDWQDYTVPQLHTGEGLIDRRIVYPSGKAVGGSSIWNAMFYVRGDKKNFDDWAKMGATGWSYKEVLPYFRKMENNMNPELVEEDYHGFHGPVNVETPCYSPTLQRALINSAQALGIPIRDINGRYQRGLYIHQATMRRGQRCSAAKAYLVPSEDRPNLHIVPEAFVTKILIQNKKAKGVLFDRNGETYQIRARREVIVSAGAVNTAKLLMLSGIGPREHLENLDIPVVEDLPVGSNFQDHCATARTYEISSLLRPLAQKLADPRNIARYIEERTGPYASTEGAVATAFLTNDPNSPLDAVADQQISFVELVAPFVFKQTNMKPDHYQALYGPYENSTLFWCVAQNLHPESRGTVSLHSADPYDPPLIDPNFLADERDVKDIVEAMKNCDRIAASEPMRRIGARPVDVVHPGCEEFVRNQDEYYECIARSFMVTVSHPVGTAKMGQPDDPSVVVDPQLRVLGIDGLRVVDASVMPLVTHGNTVTPTYMIAEKAADMIKETIRCPQRTKQRQWWHVYKRPC